MNYHFILRDDSGSGYRIECRFGRTAAIRFAADLFDQVGGSLDAVALFDKHEAQGHGMFPLGPVGRFTLVAVRD